MLKHFKTFLTIMCVSAAGSTFAANQLCPASLEFPSFENSLVAQNIVKPVIVRGKKDKLVLEANILEDLISDKSYEGKYFKIVEGKTDQAISFEADPNIQIKAATTYFHLMKARHFLKNNLENNSLDRYGQITIRLNIENKFHRSFHYIHETNAQVYNNATSITCGKPISLDIDGETQTVNGWGPEIWFRPSKKIKIEKKRETLTSAMDELMPSHSYIDTNTLITLSLSATEDNSLEVTKESLKQMGLNAGTEIAARIIVTEILMLTTPNHFYLESALVPEVIYHEFAHLFLGDYLPPTVNNPLIEGFCDYFAARVSKNSVLAKKLGEYGKMITGRDGNSRNPFKLDLDSSGQGLGSDYILSLFWQIHNSMKKENLSDSEIEKRFFELRKNLNTGSNIREDLPKALFQEFAAEKRTLIPVLMQRGL